MSLDTLIIFAGAVVAVLPFLGVPASWDRVVYFIAGVAVVALGVAVRRRGLRQDPRPKDAYESRAAQPPHEEA